MSYEFLRLLSKETLLVITYKKIKRKERKEKNAKNAKHCELGANLSVLCG